VLHSIPHRQAKRDPIWTPACAHLYHINDVLAMKDATGRNDRNLYGCTDIGDEITY
jgi:hypothetical protein